MNKNYDSDFCGNVPLNFTNMIQPYGVLLVLDKVNYNVVQVSENIGDYIGIPSSSILNKSLDTFICADQLEALKRKVGGNVRDKIPVNFTFSINGKKIPFLAIIHFKASYILMELEKLNDSENFPYIYQEVKYIMARLKNANTTEELCKLAAEEIKNLSGFDKVMIYQFDKDWNGFVVAEEKEEGMDSYLGLRFPASDIPKQARELYFKNPYRLIPDRSYTQVNLTPTLNPLNFQFTDLSDCNMRSVVPVHLEYLKNMKVEASMSTAIIKSNKLWGLISCHHRTAKFLSFEMRSAFELISSLMSTEMSAMETEQEFSHKSKLNEIQGDIYKYMIHSSSFPEALVSKSPSILNLLEVTGAVVVYNERIKTVGKVPDENFIKDILYWLKVNEIEKVFAVDSIQDVFDPEGAYKDIVSGFIAIPISSIKGEYVFGFRPELLQTVHWGGNPNEAISFEADQKTYHPRNSFSTWKETVKNTSAGWESKTIEAAEALRSSILEIIVRSNN